MNLIRLLVIVAIVWLAYRIFQNWKVKNEQAARKIKKDAPIKNMVQCAKCGVHLPEQEALKDSGNFFCCDEHKS